MNTERTLLIKNGHLYTLNQEREILCGADILVEDNIIAAVDHNLPTPDQPNRTIDATDMVVIPGMVNTHHHLFQTLYRGIDALKKQPLQDWVETMSHLTEGLGSDGAYSAAWIGMAELLLSGCTTTSDHLYIYPHSRDLFGAQVQAASDLGIRFYPVRGNLSPDETGESKWADFTVEDPDNVLTRSEKTIQQFHDPNPMSMCRVGLGPCGFYSASKDLFREIAGLADKWRLRLHTHALEIPKENELCRQLFGLSALDFLDEVGFLGSHVWLAHGVHASKEDIAHLARTDTSIAYTPICTTAKKTVTPVEQMLQAGINVGIATDGSASNDSSNMLIESRFGGRLQGMNPGIPGVSYYRGTQILELATLGGARCLGLGDEIGSIEPGKAADLVIIDTTKRLECAGSANPLEALFHTGLTRVDYTIVNGEVVVDQGVIVNQTGLGLAGMIANHNQMAEALRQKAQAALKRPLDVGWVRALPE